MGFSVEGKVGVISGSSQGLGLELTKLLVNKGASIIMISRTESKLLKARQTVLDNTTLAKDQFVECIPLELSRYSEAEKVLPLLDSLGVGKPDFVIMCAGGAYCDYFVRTPSQKLQDGIESNYLTAMNLSHVLSRRMVDGLSPGKPVKRSLWDTFRKVFTTSEDAKHLVFVSSETAFYEFIGYTQYGPAKAAIRALADILYQELKPYDITVHTLFLGNFHSEGYVEENKTKPVVCKEIEGASVPIPCEECAKIVLGKLESGHLYVYSDFMGWVLNCFNLAFGARSWGFFQVFVALFGAIFGPFIAFYHNFIIQQYFDEEGGWGTALPVESPKPEKQE